MQRHKLKPAAPVASDGGRDVADLSQEQINNVIPLVADAITKGTAGTVETRIATVALQTCNDYAPGAPESILQEAAIRHAAWLLGTPAHATAKKIMAPEGSAIELSYANAQATANGFRSSGASSMLSRYVVRRAGSIGEPL